MQCEHVVFGAKLGQIGSKRDDLAGKGSTELHQNYILCSAHFEDCNFTNFKHNRLSWNALSTLFDVSHCV